MRRIDDRLTLSATAAHILDADARPATETGAAAATPLDNHTVAVAGAKHGGGGGDDTSTLADPVHTTLALPGIGLGYASLDGVEDKETAFVLTATGLTTITAGAKGYYVKSDNPMDAALGKILGFDHASDGFADVGHAFADLAKLTFTTGQTIDAGIDRHWDIAGSSGADSIQAGGQSDLIHGAAGNDTIGGGEGDDIAWGGAGNDVLGGDNGNDQLWGGAGLDTIDGGLGDDFLFGGSGNDSVQGGDGADLLLGGTGADALLGGEGDDVLVGGGGADVLTGGAGHDLFLFAQGDSGVGATDQDKVADFTVGEDRLDLTSFTQALHVVSAFGSHAYEMVVTDTDEGSLIQIDLNGDGVADQEIAVATSDHSHLTGADYVI